jgi:hypothetical protein
MLLVRRLIAGFCWLLVLGGAVLLGALVAPGEGLLIAAGGLAVLAGLAGTDVWRRRRRIAREAGYPMKG